MCYGSSFHYRCGHLTARFTQRCDNRCRLPESDPFPLDLDCENCIRDREIERFVDDILGNIAEDPEMLEIYLISTSKDVSSYKPRTREAYLAKFWADDMEKTVRFIRSAMNQSHIDGFEMTSVRRDQKRRKFPRPPELFRGL